MSIPFIGGDLDFSEWVRGLMAAFISGGASAITGGFTVTQMDPKDYNIYGRKLYALMGTMFLINGVIGAAMFLRTKPVPDHKVVKTTVQETTVEPGVPPVKVKTVVETHAEPLEPKP